MYFLPATDLKLFEFYLFRDDSVHMILIVFFSGVKLLRAIDQVKDQTLFLCQIQQAALRRTLFPIGDITKDVVKQMAVSAGLEKIAQRKEVRQASANHSFKNEWVT